MRIQEIDEELFKLRTSYNLIIMGLPKDQASYKYNPEKRYIPGVP